jgi:ribosome recycling factor
MSTEAETTDAKSVLAKIEDKMKKSVHQLQQEFHTVRTGRANPALLERLEFEYYGTMTFVQNASTISAPDARTLLIKPFDKQSLKDIEAAITKSQLGLTPNNDGSVIRLNLPTPTEERRKEMVKVIKKYAEEARVAVRNVRREGADELKKLKLPEDELKRHEESLQKLTDKHVKDVDKHVQDKEIEIMEV